jgi:hypothetical protein
MFKDIQKKLLLKHPLLWNTKFVPMIFVGIFIHLIFFGLGYADGTIDFSNRTKIDIQAISILFGIILIIIIVILWLVNYFKNNGLKSFYSKSKNSLFYEWLQIFIIGLFLISFYIPFSIGKQLHQKSYYTLEETTKRCETISLADIFIDGSFGNTKLDSVLKSKLTEEQHSEFINKEVELYRDTNFYYFYKDHIEFNGKKYNQFSLLNRNTFEFSVISEAQDSLNKIKVQNWLYQDNKNEVKNLMANYLKLIKEHNLTTNLTLEKWYEITYKAPLFEEFLYIQPYFKEFEAKKTFRYDDYETTFEETDYENKYSKYFIQQDVLKSKYDIVSDAHTNNFIEIEMILAYLYGALGFSILVFSFRVTSGKSWLIGVVTAGIINMVYGVITVVTNTSILYFYLILFTITGIIAYFTIIYYYKKSLQLSRIALNLVLWSFTTIIPIVYFLIQEYYLRKEVQFGYNYISKEYEWLREHVNEMFTINFILSIFFLFLISKIIRNWKGIAEN